MAAAVYSMCAVASAGCAALAFLVCWRHRGQATRLVFWSAISFAWFAISNALAFVDLVILKSGYVAIPRAATACIASCMLLCDLIWEQE
jgi:hypothetical protein